MENIIVIEYRKPKDREFEALLWALKARGNGKNGDARKHFAFAKVEGGYFICTDGCQVHIVELEYNEIPDGLYEVKKANKSEMILSAAGDYIYPDAWAAIDGVAKPLVSAMVGNESTFVYCSCQTGEVYDISKLLNMYLPDAPIDVQTITTPYLKGRLLLVVSDGKRLGALCPIISSGVPAIRADGRRVLLCA